MTDNGILVYIDGKMQWIATAYFYAFMCDLNKNPKVTVDLINLEKIKEVIPEFLPNIVDDSSYGTVAGIKLIHD
jgi:hypothetical protein